MRRKRLVNQKRKDIAAKRFFALKDVFASLCNGFIFKQAGYVQPDDVTDLPTEQNYHLGTTVGSKFRDIYKQVVMGNVTVALIGVENQTNIDNAMAVRVMGYDWLGYDSQLREIENSRKLRKKQIKRMKAKSKSRQKGALHVPEPIPQKLFPVITIVLYFGCEKRWDKEQSLLSCVSVPKGVEKFFSDYKIHVVELAWLSDEELNCLTGDLKNLAEQLIEKRQSGRLKPTDYAIEHFDEFGEILAAYTNDNEVEQLFQTNKENQKMGGVVAKMREEAKAEERAKRLEVEAELKVMREQLQMKDDQLQMKDDQLQKILALVRAGDLAGVQQFLNNQDIAQV